MSGLTTQLGADLVARVLAVTAFDNCDELFWRVDEGVLSIYVTCSDFFAWGCADVEPIETEADVLLLEQARADLVATTKDAYPNWIGELYAARRRQMDPAPFMLGDGKYAMPQDVQAAFAQVKRP